MKNKKIIVSACLAGVNCRFDGKNKANKKIILMVKKGGAIPVCPEQLAGLPTPRKPCEPRGNKIIDKSGRDMTEIFQRGAEETLKIVKLIGAKEAIMKQNSPSCGCGRIPSGNFDGKSIRGDGATTKLLKNNGIKAISEENL